jgi:hypothetical protein
MKLIDPRKILSVELPSFKGGIVEMYDSLLTQELESLDSTLSEYDRGIKVLQFLVKSWPFTDDTETTLPINKENLGKLPVPDFTLLMKTVTDSMDFLGNKNKKK